MPNNRYIGARYVPKFDGAWDSTKSYEPLVIVESQGNSYTSKTYVPNGVDISNTTYWALTGNYNAQVEQYRKEVLECKSLVNNFIETFTNKFGEVKEYVDSKKVEMEEWFEGKKEEVTQLISTLTNNVSNLGKRMVNVENILKTRIGSFTNVYTGVQMGTSRFRSYAKIGILELDLTLWNGHDYVEPNTFKTICEYTGVSTPQGYDVYHTAVTDAGRPIIIKIDTLGRIDVKHIVDTNDNNFSVMASDNHVCCNIAFIQTN